MILSVEGVANPMIPRITPSEEGSSLSDDIADPCLLVGRAALLQLASSDLSPHEVIVTSDSDQKRND